MDGMTPSVCHLRHECVSGNDKQHLHRGTVVLNTSHRHAALSDSWDVLRVKHGAIHEACSNVSYKHILHPLQFNRVRVQDALLSAPVRICVQAKTTWSAKHPNQNCIAVRGGAGHAYM